MNSSPISTRLDVAGDTYRFTATELTRLAAYRAAVRAGFYTDTVMGSSRPQPSEQRWVRHCCTSATSGPLLASGFAPAEITRLVAYRDAIAAGLFQAAGDEPATA